MAAISQVTTSASTGNSTSFTIPINTASSAGRMLLVLGSIDGGGTGANPSTTSPGWQKLYYQSGPDHGIFAFIGIGTGSNDNLVMSWSNSEQIATCNYYIDNPPAISTVKYALSTPTTASTSFDPPLLSTGINQNYIWIEFASSDNGSANVANPSTNFSRLTRSNTPNSSSAAGQTSFSAEYVHAAESLKPDAFPFTRGGTASADSVGTATLAIPAGSAGPEPGRFLIAA